MASKDELRHAIAAAKKAEKASDKAVQRLTEIHVPKQARKARVNLLARLRRVGRRMAERVPALKKRLEQKRKAGAAKVVNWCFAQVGVTETPYGSNWGHPVEDWIMFTGYTSAVPWCGCFDAYAVKQIGNADIPVQVRLGYTPNICADAAAGANGLTKIALSDVRAGDILVFDFDGGGADHTGVAVGPIKNNMTDAIEGNTSSGVSGSQDNGGCVAHRSRPSSQVICAARPDYR